MLKNYLKIGLRNLLKNKLFTAINVSGMAISIASFLIIALYVYDELRFDKHIDDVHLKYRVYNEHTNDEGVKRQHAMIPPMIAPTMKSDFPEVVSYFRFLNFNSPVLFEVGTKKMTESKGGYSDPGVFDMFDLTLLEGNPATALTAPSTIAISRTVARKYFGDKPALNETIRVSGTDMTVAGVYDDFPQNSHLQLNFLISMETFAQSAPDRMQRWSWSQFHTYVKLAAGADAAALDAKLKGFAERHAWPITKEIGFYYIPRLMPLDKVHLHAYDHSWDIAVRGNYQTVYILSGTALFILVIAILNFVNLSTARAINRVKEVGVRKVVGAFRSQLVYQFISESVMIAFIALIIAGLITELTIPGLNTFTEKNIPTGVFLDPVLLGSIIAFALLVGLLAGAYPAFYISSFRPASILSGKKTGASDGKIILRKALVVLQFVLSFFLITAALVVSEQHHFLRTTDMGFEKDNIISVQLRGAMNDNFETTKDIFSDHPNIISATLGYGLPGEAFAGDGIRDKATGKDMPVSLLTVDHDYVKTLGIRLIAGRDFSKEIATDSTDAFIVSETAARQLGYQDPKEALGHEVEWNRWDDQEKVKEGKVIGVVKDFHLNTLRESITPVVIQIYPFAYSTLTMKVRPGNLDETIAHLEKSWKKFNTDWPFEYRFLDDNFDRLYKAEQKLATLFTYFTAFTIFVACLGLFGLVVYSTTQRYREISIRKVLGAGERGLVFELGKSYLLLIGVAFIIAIPFSYYAASAWLSKFAYRIPLTPYLFVKAALAILVLSLLTVGIQSLKAARANPVNALKEQ